MSPLAEAGKAEIVALHAYLMDLFTGKTRDLTRCEAAFAADMSMISPDGVWFDRKQILANLRNATAVPGFRIRIHDVQLLWESESAVLLRYVEEQYRDGETTRRLSSALFTADETAPLGVVWQHLHETWQANKDVGGDLE
jgi:hypothetical protein